MEWVKINNYRYERPDGAVVAYDHRANSMYAKDWLSGHRGWMAYLPTEEYPIYYKSKRGLHVPIKFKTHINAMKAIDKFL